MQQRLGRWREAMASVGLESDRVAFADDGLGAAALAALDDNATAVFCTSDTLAIAVIAAAGERGLAVPRDLSVIGFDDSLLASLSSPALTSVRVDYTEFGAAATTALLAEIDGATAPEYKPAAPSLELRASTAAAARS